MTDELTAQAEIHHAHRDVTGGWLRPATFGVMDGLVSNFALVAGVVGGGASVTAVTLTGLAGLAAGACSMATGEFISVTSQADLTRAEIATERRELETNPDEELKELIQVYEAKGLRTDLAELVARDLTSRPEVAWRAHVREELGIDPDDLPSPWLAAGSSFVAFSAGAFIPVLPFVFGFGSLITALVLSALALLAAGGLIAKMTARPPWLGASRQLLFGALSAAVTFAIGLLVGGSVG
jgi:VIT1/CCC1 family predicted Fe2+/Mn2+ transporter